MRKILFGLVLGCVFIAGSLYAADGDLQVNGSVGVGTAPNPTYKLDLNGTSALRGTVWTLGPNIEVGGLSTGNNFAYIDFRGDNTYTDYGLRLLRGNTGTNTWSELSHRGTSGLYIQTIDTAPLIFRTASVERMTILSSGYIGIGTTTPSKKLHIYDSSGNDAVIKVQNHTSSNSAVLWLQQSGSANGKEWYIASRSTGELAIGNIAGGAADRIFVSPTGNVGINSPNPPNLLQMEPSGGGYYSISNHDWMPGSSGRWKSDVRPITSALDTVLKLDGVSFKWKKRTDTFEDSIDGTKLYVSSSWADDPNGRADIGLIAEDVMKVLPEVVDIDQKDPNFATGVSYSKMVALLIEAIKEQQREIVKLKEDLEALKR
jgi:hypothetical protein